MCVVFQDLSLNTEMKALYLSFLFLFMQDGVTEVKAGDLETSSLRKTLTADTNNLITTIYNELTTGTLPKFALKIPQFYSKPGRKESYEIFYDAKKSVGVGLGVLKDFNHLSPDSIRNYHFLWHKYLKHEENVAIYCTFQKTNDCKKVTDFHLNNNKAGSTYSINSIRKNNSRGILLEGKIYGPPCEDMSLIEIFKLENLCNFNKENSIKPWPLLGMLKYSLQSPIFIEQEGEYQQIFARKNESFRKFGYFSQSEVWSIEEVKERPNAFVSLCSFDHDLENQRFKDCKLFSRSFTNMGIGYTANSEVADKLFKSKKFGSPGNFIYPNNEIHPTNMISAGPDYALKVLIENSRDEVEFFENTKRPTNPKGTLTDQPKERKVSLHNPLEPANIRSNSFSIPLGYSTIVYITPKVREIDASAASLEESERGCRLSSESGALDIFKIYSKESCILECKIKQAYKKCGCFPWNYPVIEVSFIE